MTTTPRRAKSTAAFALVAAALLLTPQTALADRAAAKAAFDEGNHHYNAGRFQEASEAFQRAYDEEPIPALLFNLAQAHFGAENFERAASFYEAFLREQPVIENRELVEQRFAEAKLRAKEAEDAEAARLEAERLKILEEVKRQEADEAAAVARAEASARRRAEADRERAEAEARRAEAERPVEIYEQDWFWPAAGGAAVLALVTVASGVALLVAILPPPDSLGPPGDFRPTE